MQTAKVEPLVRKQIMLSNENLAKLSLIAKKEKSSVAHIVRRAIDSYDPDAEDVELQLMIELLNTKLDDAIQDTIATREHLNKALSNLSTREMAE